MTVRAAILAVMAFLVVFTPSVSAQTAANFAGEWHSLKETKGIVSVNVVQEGGRWMVHAFGSCHPKPCDWGAAPFTILQQKPEGLAIGFATWRQGSSTRHMTFKLGEGVLYLEVYNLFSGPKDQPSYFHSEELTRTARAPASRATSPGAKK